MDAKDVRILERETVYQGYFRVDRYRLQHRRFAGDWSGTQVREVFERGHAAAVLPYDPQRDEVVLIEQFRIGAYAAAEPPWQLETVAGIIEAGEDAATVARREGLEEAGLEVGTLTPISKFLVSQGAVTETVELFCGRVDAAGAGGVHGLDHEGEDIRVRILPFEKLPELLETGAVANAVALIALQWLLLNRDRLRRDWLGESP